MASSVLTVIAAASNEMANAPEWLEHLEWVDDCSTAADSRDADPARRVIIVDTGSCDGTAEFFEHAGVEVIRIDEGGLIHGAKNRAIDRVDSGWILDLDLDERVPRELRAAIQAVVRDDPAATAAYRVPFRHYVFGRWLRFGGWRSSHLRLYRAGKVRYPEDRAHSTPIVDGGDAAVADLEPFIVHFAQPTVHDFWTKMNRYTSHDAPLILARGRGGLRNRERLGARPARWCWAAFSVFWSRYVKKAGFRDGIAGFVAAVLMAAYVFVEQAKVWELEHVSADDRSGATS